MSAVKAVSTIGTVLETSADATTWSELCAIKSYPALGGAPEQIETTDLKDGAQTYIPGVQSVEAMEFTANYTLESYLAVKTKAGTDLHYRILMGINGKDGMAAWEGQHSVFVNEGEVNGVREMTISVSPSTPISIAAKE